MLFIVTAIAAVLTALGATGNIPPAPKNWSAPNAGQEIMRDPARYVNVGDADDSGPGGDGGV